MRAILVTGGNQGIGFALCKQLAIENNCHVFLTARNPERGQTAVSEIAAELKKANEGGSVDFVPLDVSDANSIQEAAKTVKAKLKGDKLYGIVNNAGIGTRNDAADIVKTNFYGSKLVMETFLDLLDPENGRIVNVGSASGPLYVQSCPSKEDQKTLCSPETVTWGWIDKHAQEKMNQSDVEHYGLSKALVSSYTGLFAREHPNIMTSCCTPGFINTQLTAGWGASKSPEQGTMAIRKLLFEKLDGNGWYYGSDGVRSPYHFMRNPGEPIYDGVNPFA